MKRTFEGENWGLSGAFHALEEPEEGCLVGDFSALVGEQGELGSLSPHRSGDVLDKAGF